MTFTEIANICEKRDDVIGFRRSVTYDEWSDPRCYLAFDAFDKLRLFNGNKHDVGWCYTISYADITSNDWILLYKKDGYNYDCEGKLRKPCKAEVWINVYSYKNEEIEKVFNNKEDADLNIEIFKKNKECVKQKTIFVKQLHMSQQYSVPYFFDDEYVK
jgi:hypothetical protein